MIHYKVRFGDTIESIAKEYDVDPNIIMYSDSFHVGKILMIPQAENRVKPSQKITINKSLEYYLNRHANKKHLFHFYGFVKTPK